MDSYNSPVGEKDSPSQENIAHPQLIKRDGESLEDFEDITKDEPSEKDLTAKFLQFETGVSYEHPKEEFYFRHENQFDVQPWFEPKKSNSVDLYSEYDEKTSKESLGFEPPAATVFHSDPYEFEQTDFLVESMDAMEPTMANPALNILDENKLVGAVSNDDISMGSDDLSFIPKKGGSSSAMNSETKEDTSKKAPLECKSNETTDVSFNLQQLSKFTSEHGITNEQEPELLQGDGLHIRKTIEDDVSENDDDIPEPIPKDYPEIGVLEGRQFLAAMGVGTWFQPDLLHPQVESLVYWRDPKKSGIVFGGILIILLCLTSFSLISVVAYTSLIALVSALAFRIYKSVMQAVQKTSEGHPFKEYLDIDLTVNPEKGREIADIVVVYINKTLTEIRRLFLIEDVIDSIKFGVLLWSLTYIGAWFNGLSLLIIAFVGLFTLPKVYENNKTQIDANVDFVKAKVNEFTEKIAAVIPLGKKTEEVKDKGE